MILRLPAPPKVIGPPPVPVPPRQLLPIRDRLRWRFLAAAAGVVLFSVWRLHIPGKGFTALINFSDRELWRGTANPTRKDVRPEHLVLTPGETRIALRTDRPAELTPGRSDTRPLAFRVLDLRLHVVPPTP